MLKGYDKFIHKVPYLAGKRGLLIPIYAVIVLAISFLVLIFCDKLPGMHTVSRMPAIAFAPLVGVVVIEVAGFILVYQLWRLRDRLRASHGAASYSRIVPVGFAGILLVISLSFNQFIPFFAFAQRFWAHAPLTIISTPIDSLSGSAAHILFIVKKLLAALVFALGVWMAVRSLLTFGFDYMTVVYLYFPEESTMQNHRIYSVLRHPTYASAIVMCLAGTVFTLTPISLFVFVLYFFGFWIHVRFVEERELLQRFGPSYAEYRKRVPAFVVSPGKLGEFFRFLAGQN